MTGVEYAAPAPTILSAPLFVVALLFVSVVIGRRMLQLMGAVRAASLGERLVIAAAIGLGVMQFVPFALGAVGILGQTSLRVSVALLGLASLIDLRPLVAASRRWWAGRRRLAPWEWFWLLLLAVPLVHSFFVALAPIFDPDGLGYHVTAPKLWLEMGTVDFLPTLTYTSGPIGTEMLYAIGLAVVGDSGAKLVHFAATVLAAVGVYQVGTRVGGRMVGRIAATIFLYGPLSLYSIIGSGYAEGTATLAIVAGTLCWMVWFDRADRTWLRAAALLSGFAVSFKLTSFLFPVALAALTILIVRARGRRATGTEDLRPRSVGGLLALVVAPVIPGMLRSLVITGNPVFPLLAQWIPSRDFPAEMSSDFETHNRYMNWADRWGYDVGIQTRQLILGLVAIAVLGSGFVVYRRLHSRTHRAVTIVVTSTVLAQLLAAGLYKRFWIPLAAVLIIPVIALVISRIDVKLVRVGLLVLTLYLTAGAALSALRDKPVDLVLASVDQARRDEVALDRVRLAPLMRAASEDAGGRGAVLMNYGCTGFYFDGPSMCTEFLQGSLRLSNWDDFNHDLDELGITHVIAPTALATGGPRPDDGNGAGSVGYLARDGVYTMVSRLLRERGELLWTEEDQSAYRLRPADA